MDSQNEPKRAPRELSWELLKSKRASKRAKESYLGVSWGCLGVIKSSRYVKDSTKIAPRELTKFNVGAQILGKWSGEVFTT